MIYPMKEEGLLWFMIFGCGWAKEQNYE